MSDVYVYVYDLSKGLARSMSQALLGRQIDGVWHTGIVAYGMEWYFGSGGISSCPPCGTILGQPDEKKFQGRTAVSYDDFYSHISNLSQTTFKGSDYHLLNHNCNNFSDHISEFLTGRKIPPHITGLPSEVLSTPFGQMLMPMLEQMSVNPDANHSVNFRPSSGPAPSVSNSSHSSANANLNASNSSSSSMTSKLAKSVSISATEIEKAAAALDSAVQDGDEKAQLKEIKEYCLLPASTTVDWSLGRPHLYLLARLASSSSSSSACDLLAAFLSREELVAMTTRDPQKTLQTMTSSCDSRHDFIRVLANLTRHSAQRRWFLQTEEPLVKGQPDSATAYALFTRLLEALMERRFSDAHSYHFSVLFHNTCLGLADSSTKSGADADSISGMALEMTTPLLEFFVKLQSESTTATSAMTSCVETLLEAMDVLVTLNADAKELSKCYGIEVDSIHSLAPQAKQLAEKIFH